MKSPARTTLRWALLSLLALGALGCSGINASKSVSPLDFFLPGLIKTGPPPSAPNQPNPEPDRLLAQVH